MDEVETIFINDKMETMKNVPESPKPTAFTIDFGDGNSVDTERHKSLVEKYQKRHRRGQSLSKLENVTKTPTTVKKHPLSARLPRKAQSEGYYSSDEKTDSVKSVSSVNRELLSLPLKNATSDMFGQLPSILSPELELQNTVMPDLQAISPFTPKKPFVKQLSSPECEMRKFEDNFVDEHDLDAVSDSGTYTIDADNYSEEQKARMSIDRQFKMEEVSVYKKTCEYVESLAKCRSYLSDKIDIDEKTKDYKSEPYLASNRGDRLDLADEKMKDCKTEPYLGAILGDRLDLKQKMKTTDNKSKLKNANNLAQKIKHNYVSKTKLSPTQNISLLHQLDDELVGNSISGSNLIYYGGRTHDLTSTINDQGSIISVTTSGIFRTKPTIDETKCQVTRKLSLTKSEVQIETYTDGGGDRFVDGITVQYKPNLSANLILVSENVPSSTTKRKLDEEISSPEMFEVNVSVGKLVNLPPSGFGKTSPSKIPSPIHTNQRPRSRDNHHIDLSDSSLETESYLQPTQHLLQHLQQKLSIDDEDIKYLDNIETRRTRDLHSDDKRAQKLLQHLQQKLSIDDDFEKQTTYYLNNDSRCLLNKKRSSQQMMHVRHNSLDEKSNMNIADKLEHFQMKSLVIDQTLVGSVANGCSGKLLNQYSPKIQHKIQNSPNNTPIRRSSSFSTRNQLTASSMASNKKLSNIPQSISASPKDHINFQRNSPHFASFRNALDLKQQQEHHRTSSVQRSSSTASMRAQQSQCAQRVVRRSSLNSIENDSGGATTSNSNYVSPEFNDRRGRSVATDDESSSSEDEYIVGEKKVYVQKKKDLTNTRYNRAFSLRRGRLDEQLPPSSAAIQSFSFGPASGFSSTSGVKCPNTPEMRRKFPVQTNERSVSMERRIPSSASSCLTNNTKTNNDFISMKSTNHFNRNHHTNNRPLRPMTAVPALTKSTESVASSSSTINSSRQSLYKPKSATSSKNVAGGALSRHDTTRLSTRSAGGRIMSSTNSINSNHSTVIASQHNNTHNGNLNTSNSSSYHQGSGKNVRRDSATRKQSAKISNNSNNKGPRSNSSLTSKEVDFQNWKRRKSYDPMKSAAEGKRRQAAAVAAAKTPLTHTDDNDDGNRKQSSPSSIRFMNSVRNYARGRYYNHEQDELGEGDNTDSIRIISRSSRMNGNNSGRDLMTRSYHAGEDLNDVFMFIEGGENEDRTNKIDEDRSSSMSQRTSSVHRSQSFNGTAAMDHLIISSEDEAEEDLEEEDEDITLSADEVFSPPTPSPTEHSPQRHLNSQRYAWNANN